MSENSLCLCKKEGPCIHEKIGWFSIPQPEFPAPPEEDSEVFLECIPPPPPGPAPVLSASDIPSGYIPPYPTHIPVPCRPPGNWPPPPRYYPNSQYFPSYIPPPPPPPPLPSYYQPRKIPREWLRHTPNYTTDYLYRGGSPCYHKSPGMHYQRYY
ncbi:leucine-rich repeat extensin-like protein 3 isoform X11 [Sitophilus oryzae]|uniref:Leucine-rich repeat extensin-like protein 3 isoform X11 n=1 Tax=Sitophilus oryzae TaxID=7048 RepID=A0A6J2Y751_SITOR|nr:leucine-rich repeat extensin-like protein 3 isoform X11 [Sitophilus oryzae]